MAIHTLAIPPLGCGNGGLKWCDFRPLIEKHLGTISDLEIFVYETGVAVSYSLFIEDSSFGSAEYQYPL